MDEADVGFGTTGALEDVEGASPGAEEDWVDTGVDLVAVKEGCFI